MYKKKKKIATKQMSFYLICISFLRLFTDQKKAKRIILQQLISDVSVNRNTPTRARQGSRLNFCPVTDSFARTKVSSTSFRMSLILIRRLRHYVTMKFGTDRTIWWYVVSQIEIGWKRHQKLKEKAYELKRSKDVCFGLLKQVFAWLFS